MLQSRSVTIMTRPMLLQVIDLFTFEGVCLTLRHRLRQPWSIHAAASSPLDQHSPERRSKSGKVGVGR